MKSLLSYLIEKFHQALFDLATGEGDARSRIKVAFYRYWTIPIEDFPESLRKDRERITVLLTRLGGKQGYVIPENLRRMKKSTAAEIARLTHSIYFRLLDIRTDDTNA